MIGERGEIEAAGGWGAAELGSWGTGEPRWTL